MHVHFLINKFTRKKICKLYLHIYFIYYVLTNNTDTIMQHEIRKDILSITWVSKRFPIIIFSYIEYHKPT